MSGGESSFRTTFRLAVRLLFAGAYRAVFRRVRKALILRRLKRIETAESYRLWLDAELLSGRDRPGTGETDHSTSPTGGIALIFHGPAPESGEDVFISGGELRTRTAFPSRNRKGEVCAVSMWTEPRDGGGWLCGNLRRLLTGLEEEIVILVERGSGLLASAGEEVARAFAGNPGGVALFGDEVLEDRSARIARPFFRAGVSPRMLEESYSPGPVLAFHRERVKPFLRNNHEGALPAIYALLLRLADHEGALIHLPRPLGWTETGCAEHRLKARYGRLAPVAGRWIASKEGDWRTVERGDLPGTWRHRWCLPAKSRISIIIPARDRADYLERCIDSLFANPPSCDFEVIVADNDSRQAAARKYLADLEKTGRARIHSSPGPFNYSGICNGAAAVAAGNLLLFLNNDTEITRPGSLDALAEEASRPSAGPVGALLLYPDGSVQHAGIVIGMGGEAGHLFKGMSREGVEHFPSPLLPRDVSAVTGACLMIRRDRFFSLGGFNENDLPVAFNDVDLCLRARQEGYTVRYTPYAAVIHHESVSRPNEVEPREILWMERRWGRRLFVDPFYHPSLAWYDEKARILLPRMK